MRSLKQHATRYRRHMPKIDNAMLESLRAHSWPGNVRELSNLAERTVVMGPGPFEFEPTQETPLTGAPALEPGFSLSDHLEEVARQVLVAALQKAGGDRNQAGRLLGVERNTLRYKLNKYGLLDK
jgi:DNA-binding NtrC family response regulator